MYNLPTVVWSFCKTSVLMLWSHCARHWNLLHRGFYHKEFWRKWFSSEVCNSEQNFGIVAPFAQICCSNVAFNAQICCILYLPFHRSVQFLIFTMRVGFSYFQLFKMNQPECIRAQCSSNQRLAEKNWSHICNGNQLIKSNAGRIAAIKGRRRIVSNFNICNGKFFKWRNHDWSGQTQFLFSFKDRDRDRLYPCPGVQMEIFSKKTDQDDDVSVWCTSQEAPSGLWSRPRPIMSSFDICHLMFMLDSNF